MKHDRLLDAIGEIRDEYVEEGEQAKLTRREKGQAGAASWKKIGGLAAALLLVAGLGLGLGQLNLGSTTSTAQDAASVTSGDRSEEIADAAMAPEEAAAEEKDASQEEGLDQQGSLESAEETLERPPMLTILDSDLVLYPENYDWTVYYGKEAQSTVGCGTTVLEQEDTISVLGLSGEDHFSFQTEGAWTEVTALCYPESSWGDHDAEGTLLTVEGNTVTLPDGAQSWILSLNLTWACDDYSGSAEYHLLVTQN